jgi:hypothetical protein
MNGAEPVDQRGPTGGSTRGLAGVPHWVKIFVLISLVVILIMVAAMIVTGHHGMGRHQAASGLAEGTAVSSAASAVDLAGMC